MGDTDLVTGDARSLIVHDGNPDALDRRRDALSALDPRAHVIATPSTTAVQVLALDASPGTPILIDLCAGDRLSLDRPGERLIERLAHRPATAHVRPIAWSAHVGADVVARARAAGADGFVTATLRRETEADELTRAIAGDPVWPTVASPPHAWDAWFEQAYATPWQPWMEPVLVRLAETGERRSVAAELVERGAARTAGHAASRMREVARIIAGEHSNTPTVVAHRASLVLARLAAHAPLTERPAVPMSLQLAADAIRDAPSLALAAGLGGGDVDDLLAVDQLIRGQDATAGRGAGAPPADKVRSERRWAAGRRALEHGAGVDDVDAVITGILRRLDHALVAIDDAQVDAERYPAPRAAAALIAAGRIEAGGLDAVDADGVALTWRGRTAAQLALADDLPTDTLRELTATIDAALAARRPSVA